MSQAIRADYRQRLLLPPSVEDWVPAEHPARLIRDVVDALDLDELGFEPRLAVEGRPHYAADLLLKVWLYGYLNRIRSSRRLEQACYENLGVVWLTGQHYPDHNTLWRFWQSNRAALKKVYQAVLRLAVQQGLVGFVLHALDGTKIAAHGARDEVWTRESLEKLLAELDTVVEEGMQQVEAAEAAASGPGYALPPDWTHAALRRERVREALQQLEQTERTQVHPQEPEARQMKTRREGLTWAYNAQAVVDADSGLIVASEVVNDQTDNHQLVPMLEQVEETAGQVAADTVADSGYGDAETLVAADAKGYGVVVSTKGQIPARNNPQGEFHVSRFEYDAATDSWQCPRGERLAYERDKDRGWRRGGANRLVRLYRCAAFENCPVRWQCSRDPHGRTISRDRFYWVRERQRARQAQPAKRALLRRRREIIELPFAVIKTVLGFRRFSSWGLAGAQAQWAMVCTAYNLRKLLLFWRAGTLRLA